jgi:FtsH-binding integral membrane protein
MSAATAMLLFWIYAAVMGLSLGSIFLVFIGTSIARVFFITAVTYGTMSLYCDTIRTDLSHFGSFLTMGPIGIVIASLVNIFIKSNTLQFVISIVGVIVFVGLPHTPRSAPRRCIWSRTAVKSQARRRCSACWWSVSISSICS